MGTEKLADLINSLTAEQQEAVECLIEFLKTQRPSPFLAAVDEFIDEHPELLRRLAQ